MWNDSKLIMIFLQEKVKENQKERAKVTARENQKERAKETAREKAKVCLIVMFPLPTIVIPQT